MIEALHPPIEHALRLLAADAGGAADLHAGVGPAVDVAVEPAPGRDPRVGGERLVDGEKRLLEGLRAGVVPDRLRRRVEPLARRGPRASPQPQPDHRAGEHHARRGEADDPPPARIGIVGERGQQIRHRRPAHVGAGGQRAHDDLAQPQRHLGPGGRLADLAGERIRRQRLPGRTGEGQLAIERLVERRREAELIAARVDRLAEVLLRRHVRRRSEDAAGRGDPDRRAELGPRRLALPLRARQPEVRDPSAPVGADEDVVRLEVAVHQADRVRGLDAAASLDEHRDDLAPAPRGRRQPAGQGLPLDELHGDEQLIIVHPDIEHADDIGVGELRHRLRLA